MQTNKTIISARVGFSHHLANNDTCFNQSTNSYVKKLVWTRLKKGPLIQTQQRIGNNFGAPKFTFVLLHLINLWNVSTCVFLSLENTVIIKTNCLLSRWSPEQFFFHPNVLFKFFDRVILSGRLTETCCSAFAVLVLCKRTMTSYGATTAFACLNLLILS